MYRTEESTLKRFYRLHHLDMEDSDSDAESRSDFESRSSLGPSSGSLESMWEEEEEGVVAGNFQKYLSVLIT